MDYRKELHGVYSLTCHLILVKKYRQLVFMDQIGIIKALKTNIIELSEEFEVKVVEIECSTDHVHLLISARARLDIPKHGNTIKGHSSRFLRKEHESFLQDKSWNAHFWSPSNHISSTGNASIDVLNQHVENQWRKIALEH